MHKDAFINEYKRSNVIKDCENFLKKIEELKPYMIKFKKNVVIKTKIYIFDCKEKRLNLCPIIIIIHDKCIFSINNSI